MKTANPKSKIQNPKSAFRALARTLRFNEQGLIPAVIQDAASREVLTLCYLNRAALKKSMNTGTVYLFRRSQQRLMQKGETSGHIQVIKELRVDCEGQSLVVLIRQRVAACHAGYFSCYFRRFTRQGLVVTARRVFNPATVYRSP